MSKEDTVSIEAIERARHAATTSETTPLGDGRLERFETKDDAGRDLIGLNLKVEGKDGRTYQSGKSWYLADKLPEFKEVLPLMVYMIETIPSFERATA